MKTEDFDDAIRQKMGSIDSSHDQEEVELIHRFIQTSKPKGSNRLDVVFGFLAVVLLIMGSLLTWNIFQMKEHDELKQTVQNLEANLKQSKSNIFK